MAEPVIRPATPADVATLRAVAEAAYEKYVPRLGRRPAPMDADFAAHQASAEAHALEVDGRVVGYVVLVAEPDNLQVLNLAVLPEFQGRGLGIRLLRLAEREARRLGFQKTTLYTNEKMTENHALYSSFGYKEIERRTADGFHRVYMAKTLASG